VWPLRQQLASIRAEIVDAQRALERYLSPGGAFGKSDGIFTRAIEGIRSAERGRLQAVERDDQRAEITPLVRLPSRTSETERRPGARLRARHRGPLTPRSFYEQGSLAFVLSGTPAGTISVAVHLAA
jgi:hypothetical protein